MSPSTPRLRSISPRRKSARSAKKEYWETYSNMKGMAILNEGSPQRRERLPAHEPIPVELTHTRSPAYTIGNRKDLPELSLAPGPGAYSPRDLSPRTAPRWGNTSGYANDRQPKPGPGSYDPKDPPKPATSFGPPPRILPEHIRNSKLTPGPTDYVIPGTIGSKGAGTFGPPRKHSPRTARDKGDSGPGPGSYDLGSSLSPRKPKGPCFKGRAFDPWATTSNPGPGSYEARSQFDVDAPQGGKGIITLKGREILDEVVFPI